MLDQIPNLLSISLAARLAGLSPASFRALIEDGSVNYGPDGMAGRFYVSRSSLERAMGREITLDECRAADKGLKPRRDRAKVYRRAMKNINMYREPKR